MPEIIDMSVVDELLELCDDGDPELLVDLINMFLEDGPNRVNGILEGLESNDLEKVEQAAHSLKGSAGNLGARRLQQLSDAVQIATRTDDTAVLPDLSVQIQAKYSEAETALREILSRYES